MELTDDQIREIYIKAFNDGFNQSTNYFNADYGASTQEVDELAEMKFQQYLKQLNKSKNETNSPKLPKASIDFRKNTLTDDQIYSVYLDARSEQVRDKVVDTTDNDNVTTELWGYDYGRIEIMRKRVSRPIKGEVYRHYISDELWVDGQYLDLITYGYKMQDEYYREGR